MSEELVGYYLVRALVEETINGEKVRNFHEIRRHCLDSIDAHESFRESLPDNVEIIEPIRVYGPTETLKESMEKYR